MAKPPRKHLKRQFWKVLVAEHSMTMVQNICDVCIRENPTGDSPLGYALMAAICVTYAKPFVDNRAVGAISSKFGRYRDAEKDRIHRQLLHARDNLFAHQSPDRAKVHIRISAQEQGEWIQYQFHRSLEQSYLHPRIVPTIREMTVQALNALATERDKVMGLLFGDSHWPTGLIVLNLNDDS